MKLSKTSAQAALATVYLATKQDQGFIQARQVAEHLRIPTDSALKILQALVQHGLIESRLGRSGGYRLTASPKLVTLLQIIEAIDGPVTAALPAVNAQGHLDHNLKMLQNACDHVAKQIRQQLQKTTVADLLQDEPLYVSPASYSRIKAT